MFRNTHRLHKQLAAAIAVVALAVPATSSAVPSALRSPDASDAGIQAQQAQSTYQDLRGADANDAGQPSESPASPAVEQAKSTHQNLRGADVTYAGQPSKSPGSPAVVKSSDFDWGDAGIGAGSVLGLVLILSSVMFTVVHRRNRPATT
jgi:hypothetical protein